MDVAESLDDFEHGAVGPWAAYPPSQDTAYDPSIRVLPLLREKIREIYSDDTYLAKVTRMGAEKARENASKTLKEVREIIGLKAF